MEGGHPSAMKQDADTAQLRALDAAGRSSTMGYGIGGVLILILVILLIIYFAKRV